MLPSTILLFILPLLAQAAPRGEDTIKERALVAKATFSSSSVPAKSSSSIPAKSSSTVLAKSSSLLAKPSTSTVNKQSSSTNPTKSSSIVPAKSSSTTTKQSNAATSTTSSPNSTIAADCSCGYVLSKYNNAYFPKALRVSFDTVKSIADLNKAGFEVNTGWGIGTAADDGGHAIGSTNNVGFSNGAMTLKVPGGQKKGKAITGAEINFANSVGGGVFTMNAQLSAVEGTCQSIFTYTSDSSKYGDEQDVEILSTSILTSTNGVPPGVQLTNYDPANTGNNDAVIDPFPNNPTTGYNDYTIGWLKGGTKYFYNAKVLNSPTKYSSIHNSLVLINNWSSGDESFTAGPPVKDNILQVKSVTFYYQTQNLDAYPALPSGCTQAKACIV
ncbi:uncharacterized protein IL334_005879 [Kwoniella shivajii]|uniref:GH16 domain-containing protein n=1 Tax=Kwoniella shivajii TaxID=564305 RepID=A0ABZ1D5M5_9TREE|nr:hypothetical protein IL334_005879 [Kwoniella shivajii]